MQQILAENTISIYDLFARTLNMFIFNDKFMPYILIGKVFYLLSVEAYCLN